MPAASSSSISNRFKSLRTDNRYLLTSHARSGLASKVFYDFADAIKMPEKKLASIINLSSRTISNYKEKKKKLEPIYSEHLLKLIALYKKGEDIFGNIDEFNYWLNKPFWNSGVKPVDWISTSGGVDLISEEIDKMAQGYPV